MNLTKPEFAEYVTYMRESVGLSHEELAKLLGVNTETVKYYENQKDRRMPRDLHIFLYDFKEVIKNERNRKKSHRKVGS
jgi:predicted transcriptional regulator